MRTPPSNFYFLMVIINKLYLSKREKASVFPLMLYKTKTQMPVTDERSINNPLHVAAAV